MSPTVPPATAAQPGPQVRCPSCGELHLYATDNPYRPFCSKGCQAIDLGAWASEQYRVAPAHPASEEPGDDFAGGAGPQP